ncbi:MAG: hypothetical protein L0H63_03400 [Nitrococcus sp.]|nr:hypothetical protein [Nitrococcus sp.]
MEINTAETPATQVRITRRLDAIRAMQKRLARLRDPANPAVDSLLRERSAAADSE